MSNESVRREFEAYLRINGHPENKLKRIENNEYDFASTSLYWKQWQHQQQKIDALRGALEKIARCTEDQDPPFRCMEKAQMQNVARKALEESK